MSHKACNLCFDLDLTLIVGGTSRPLLAKPESRLDLEPVILSVKIDLHLSTLVIAGMFVTERRVRESEYREYSSTH